jgi:hypothetical protein
MDVKLEVQILFNTLSELLLSHENSDLEVDPTRHHPNIILLVNWIQFACGVFVLYKLDIRLVERFCYLHKVYINIYFLC